nr:hypothetical protein L204_04211 [Cryptococcus depauperatus CBS 7855]
MPYAERYEMLSRKVLDIGPEDNFDMGSDFCGRANMGLSTPRGYLAIVVRANEEHMTETTQRTLEELDHVFAILLPVFARYQATI